MGKAQDDALPLLLNEEQVSRLAGLSISFLRKSRMRGAAGRGTLAPPHVRVNGRRLYRRADVLMWVEGLTARNA
jgi:hypothetical protein